MRRALGRPGWLLGASLLAALGLGAGCAGEPTEGGTDEAVAEVASAGQEPQDSTRGTLRRFLPDEMQRSTRAETFAHDAHVQISCAVCHTVPEGHGSHGSVECADCHRASAMATVQVLGPEQCAACHHGAEQALACADCHESRGVVQSTQRLALEVWAESRDRTFAFDHQGHSELDCASCHQSAPLLTPAAPCASCHEEHHEPTVRCQSCHLPPIESAHDVQSHLTCSGSGCHRAREVEAIAGTRAVCLVCHQDQEEHEPAGDCIECHRVRPGLDGRGDR